VDHSGTPDLTSSVKRKGSKNMNRRFYVQTAVKSIDITVGWTEIIKLTME